jgi:hypothetical protein
LAFVLILDRRSNTAIEREARSEKLDVLADEALADHRALGVHAISN